MKYLTVKEQLCAHSNTKPFLNGEDMTQQKDRIEQLINGLDYPILADDFKDLDRLMYILNIEGKDLQITEGTLYIICYSLAVDGRIIAYLEPFKLGFNFISCVWWQDACEIMPELIAWKADFTYLTATHCQPTP